MAVQAASHVAFPRSTVYVPLHNGAVLGYAHGMLVLNDLDEVIARVDTLGAVAFWSEAEAWRYVEWMKGRVRIVPDGRGWEVRAMSVNTCGKPGAAPTFARLAEYLV